jgi:hypothetical protein
MHGAVVQAEKGSPAPAAPKWIDDFTALIQGNIEAGTETP